MDIVKKSYYSSLSRLFNYTFFNKVYNDESIEKEFDIFNKSGLSAYVKNDNAYSTVLHELYTLFSKKYRCEYIYKNEIIKEIYLSRRELFDEVVILNEFKINYSKADFMVLNGHSSIYEIKTDLDNIDRLEGQIADYLKVAQEVYIVTSPKFVKTLVERICKSVGIIVFENDGSLLKVREAQLNTNIDFAVVFSTLNNNEHRSIIKSKYKILPDVENTRFYETYFQLFNNIERQEAYALYIRELKRRRKNRFNPIGVVPNHLLGIAINQKNITSLEEFLLICDKKISLH